MNNHQSMIESILKVATNRKRLDGELHRWTINKRALAQCKHGDVIWRLVTWLLLFIGKLKKKTAKGDCRDGKLMRNNRFALIPFSRAFYIRDKIIWTLNRREGEREKWVDLIEHGIEYRNCRIFDCQRSSSKRAFLSRKSYLHLPTFSYRQTCQSRETIGAIPRFTYTRKIPKRSLHFAHEHWTNTHTAGSLFMLIYLEWHPRVGECLYDSPLANICMCTHEWENV